MTIDWRHPYSATVIEMGYDDEAGELIVRWARGGKTSVYSGVSFEQFDRLVKSSSVGAALAADNKPHHPHRYA